ncbi:MAG: TerB family tellurite resistance protein [Alphaproteobacteria bacterium]|nr:TerB family tellurite resistance protein [Alphaproteobacteria bacterium]
MFEKLRAFFAAPRPPAEAENELGVAVAALLVEAARADEFYDDTERGLIDRFLARHFNLDADAAADLRARGEQKQAQANDLHGFTKIIKTLSGPEKIALIERMWEIVLSDARRDPHEEALIRRVCGLIYVSDPESGAARHRAETALREGRA